MECSRYCQNFKNFKTFVVIGREIIAQAEDNVQIFQIEWLFFPKVVYSKPSHC